MSRSRGRSRNVVVHHSDELSRTTTKSLKSPNGGSYTKIHIERGGAKKIFRQKSLLFVIADKRRQRSTDDVWIDRKRHIKLYTLTRNPISRQLTFLYWRWRLFSGFLKTLKIQIEKTLLFKLVEDFRELFLWNFLLVFETFTSEGVRFYDSCNA